MFKISHKRIYSTITNYHILDTSLSLEAKGLMTWFLCDVKKWDGSLEGILELNTKLDKTKLINVLNELKQSGYIEIDKTGNYKVNEKSKNSRQSDSDDKDRSEQEISEEIANKKRGSQNLYIKCVNQIEEYTKDENLRKILKEYLKLRLNPGSGTRLYSMPLKYFNQWRNLLINLDTLEGDKYKIVERSIKNQWAKFVDIPKSRDDVKSHSYTSKEKEEFRKRIKELEEKGEKGVF